MVTEIFALSGKDSISFDEFRRIASSIASDGLPVWRGPFTFNIDSPDTFLNKVILSRISYIREARSWGDTHLHFFDSPTKPAQDNRRHGKGKGQGRGGGGRGNGWNELGGNSAEEFGVPPIAEDAKPKTTPRPDGSPRRHGAGKPLYPIGAPLRVDERKLAKSHTPSVPGKGKKCWFFNSKAGCHVKACQDVHEPMVPPLHWCVEASLARFGGRRNSTVVLTNSAECDGYIKNLRQKGDEEAQGKKQEGKDFADREKAAKEKKKSRKALDEAKGKKTQDGKLKNTRNGGWTNSWDPVEESSTVIEEVPEEFHESGHDGHGGNRSANPVVGLWQGKEGYCPLPTELIHTDFTDLEGELHRLVKGPSLGWALKKGPEVLKRYNPFPPVQALEFKRVSSLAFIGKQGFDIHLNKLPGLLKTYCYARLCQDIEEGVVVTDKVVKSLISAYVDDAACEAVGKLQTVAEEWLPQSRTAGQSAKRAKRRGYAPHGMVHIQDWQFDKTGVQIGHFTLFNEAWRVWDYQDRLPLTEDLANKLGAVESE